VAISPVDNVNMLPAVPSKNT